MSEMKNDAAVKAVKKSGRGASRLPEHGPVDANGREILLFAAKGDEKPEV